MLRHGLNGRQTARLLEMHYTLISNFITGKRLPGREYAIRIERTTGIPVEAWSPTRVGARELVGATAGRKAKSGR